MPDTYDFEIYFFGLICIHGQYVDRGRERKNKVMATHLPEILAIVGNYPVFAHPECSNTNWP